MIDNLSPDCARSIVHFQTLVETILFSRTCKRFVKEIWNSSVCDKHKKIIKDLRQQTGCTFGPGSCGIPELLNILGLLRGKINWQPAVKPFEHLGEELVFKFDCYNGNLLTQTDDEVVHSYDPITKTTDSWDGFQRDVYPTIGSNTYTVKRVWETYKLKKTCKNKKRIEEPVTFLYWIDDNKKEQHRKYIHGGPVALNETHEYIIIAGRIHFKVHSLLDNEILFEDDATREPEIKEPNVKDYVWEGDDPYPVWTQLQEKEELTDESISDLMKRDRGGTAFIRNITICDEGFCVIVRLNRGGVSYENLDHKTAYEWRIYYNHDFERLGTYQAQVDSDMDLDFTSNTNALAPIITKQFVWDSLTGIGKLSRITEDKKLVDMKMNIMHLNAFDTYATRDQKWFSSDVRLQLLPGQLLAQIRVNNYAGEYNLRLYHYRVRNDILELYELCKCYNSFNEVFGLTDDLKIMVFGDKIPTGPQNCDKAEEITLIMGEIIAEEQGDKDKRNNKNEREELIKSMKNDLEIGLL